MGWCSATGIMDRAVKAAETAVLTALASVIGSGVSGAQAWLDDINPEGLDNTLSPFVAELADVLRDGDWDCIEESEYFDRFAQEMLGHTDDEHRAWLVEQIKDFAEDDRTEQVIEWSQRLTEFQRKTGN